MYEQDRDEAKRKRERRRRRYSSGGKLHARAAVGEGGLVGVGENIFPFRSCQVPS